MVPPSSPHLNQSKGHHPSADSRQVAQGRRLQGVKAAISIDDDAGIGHVVADVLGTGNLFYLKHKKDLLSQMQILTCSHYKIYFSI